MADINKHVIDYNEITIDVTKGLTTSASNPRCVDDNNAMSDHCGQDGFVYTNSFNYNEDKKYEFNDYNSGATNTHMEYVGSASSQTDTNNLGLNCQIARNYVKINPGTVGVSRTNEGNVSADDLYSATDENQIAVLTTSLGKELVESSGAGTTDTTTNQTTYGAYIDPATGETKTVGSGESLVATNFFDYSNGIYSDLLTAVRGMTSASNYASTVKESSS